MAETNDAYPAPPKFLEVLTAASTVAGARNSAEVGAEELLLAIRVVRGEMDMAEVGDPVHPLLVAGNQDRSVPANVQEIVQRWFAYAGGNA